MKRDDNCTSYCTGCTRFGAPDLSYVPAFCTNSDKWTSPSTDLPSDLHHSNLSPPLLHQNAHRGVSSNPLRKIKDLSRPLKKDASLARSVIRQDLNFSVWHKLRNEDAW